MVSQETNKQLAEESLNKLIAQYTGGDGEPTRKEKQNMVEELRKKVNNLFFGNHLTNRQRRFLENAVEYIGKEIT